MRRISLFQQVPRSFTEFTLSRKTRSFASLRRTAGEGLRMTVREIFAIPSIKLYPLIKSKKVFGLKYKLEDSGF
jgi:hypothetical protein